MLYFTLRNCKIDTKMGFSLSNRKMDAVQQKKRNLRQLPSSVRKVKAKQFRMCIFLCDYDSRTHALLLKTQPRADSANARQLRVAKVSRMVLQSSTAPPAHDSSTTRDSSSMTAIIRSTTSKFTSSSQKEKKDAECTYARVRSDMREYTTTSTQAPRTELASGLSLLVEHPRQRLVDRCSSK